jgi:hypothetical protein
MHCHCATFQLWSLTTHRKGPAEYKKGTSRLRSTDREPKGQTAKNQSPRLTSAKETKGQLAVLWRRIQAADNSLIFLGNHHEHYPCN